VGRGVLVVGFERVRQRLDRGQVGALELLVPAGVREGERGDVGDASGKAIDRVTEAATRAVDTEKGCKLVRCGLTGAGGEALTYELVYDDLTASADLLARNRSAVIRSMIETLRPQKLRLVRASDQPPAPLPL